MSPKRRFLSAFFGGPVDRIPVGNVVSTITVDLMKQAGAFFPEAHRDAAVMARLAVAGHEVLGYDTVMPVYSVTQETAALGCEVDWGAVDRMPATLTHPFAEAREFGVPDGWMDAPSIRVVLDALSILRRQLGDHVVIVGKVMGPWSLGYGLMGVEEFLVSTIEDPERCRRCLRALMGVPVAFARAQMQAGADIICLADHATGSMVSPQCYRDLLLPIHQEMLAAMACPTVLHCCGNTTDRVGYFAETGIDCYHFESHVKVRDAVAAAGGRITLMGNINNPELLFAKKVEDVLAAARRAIADGVNLLAPECAVPLTTPTENLKALVTAAEETRR